MQVFLLIQRLNLVHIYTVVVCANRFIVGYETVYVEKLHVGILRGFSQILECAVSFNLFFSLLIEGFCMNNDKVTGTCTYFTTLIIIQFLDICIILNHISLRKK